MLRTDTSEKLKFQYNSNTYTLQETVRVDTLSKMPTERFERDVRIVEVRKMGENRRKNQLY